MYRITAEEECVLDDVVSQLLYAREKFPRPFVNAHEGASVIREEFDEMWDEIKADNREAACEEAIQVAAMAIRFVIELKGRDRDKEEGRE